MHKREFRELLTPFLREKLSLLAEEEGEQSPRFKALARQYVRLPDEDAPGEEANLRHYDADLPVSSEGASIPGVERLYRRTLVVEPTLACAAHCRFCIRAHYPRHNLTEDQLIAVARFCGSPECRDELCEVLVTGGDSLLTPRRVRTLIEALERHAPNVRTIRIASRIPVQDPRRIEGEVLDLFRPRGSARIELATQINHPVELFPEVIDALRRIQDCGPRIYAQNVLLRGVNDDLESLLELYDQLRMSGVEAHYLFHCLPMAGMAHLRTTLDEMLALTRRLLNSGGLSGRGKPLPAAMTEIGKIVLLEGTVQARSGRRTLLQSEYLHAERLRWNPGWRTPEDADVDAEGRLRIWYLDGEARDADEAAESKSGFGRSIPLGILKHAG